MSDTIAVDKTVISWLLAAAGGFILFLLGLGSKHLLDQLKKLPQLCISLEQVKAKYDRDMAELKGSLRVLEQRLEDLEDKS